MNLLQQRIILFLIELNGMIDGIFIEDTTDWRFTRASLSFSAKITSPFISGAMWSPSDIFFDIVKKLVKKHFDVNEEGITYNNTRTVFYFTKRHIGENLRSFEEEF